MHGGHVLRGRGTTLALCSLPKPGVPLASSWEVLMFRAVRFTRILALAGAAFLAVSSSAFAQSEQSGATFDLFGAYVRAIDSDGDSDTESYGIRGGYRFTRTWAVEASLSKLNEDVDLYFGDLSLKAYVMHSDRFEIYALAGAGKLRIEEGIFEEDEDTAHAGIGAEISLGERAVLRPEVRGRWFTDDLKFDDGIVDYSLGVGWRF
jgi:hypothetical protein